MLTISSGHSADYLTGAVAVGRENYYTGAVAAGEPPGRWYGKGAEQLGLEGQVDVDDMTALYEHYIDPRDPAFHDPDHWDEAARLGHTGRRYATAEEIYAAALAAEPDATPERREELHLEAGQRARKNVAFLDATFSVQKSITVLHTAFEAQEVAARTTGEMDVADAWHLHRDAVEQAIWAGNRAGLDYLSEHAGYSRIGHHGGSAGRFMDAHEWTVASFFQHDNRDHEPQLHIHNAILNRVQGTDGQWRTLDSKAIHKFRGAAASVAERTTEEHLARSLGVEFVTRPDGKAREIRGIRPEVLDLFSTRRRAITAKTAQLVDAFEAKFGRAPNGLERDRLQRRATFATRNAKTHDGETVEQRLERWDRQLKAEVAGGLASVAQDVLDIAGQQPEAPAWSPPVVIETALADIQAKKAAWTRPDLARAISDALPDNLGGMDAAQIRAVIDGLTDQAIRDHAVELTADAPGATTLPDELRLDDGRSSYDAPAGRLYATPGHLSAERALRAAAIERGAPAADRERVEHLVDELAAAGIKLGEDQAAAVAGILTSGAKVEALVGPAGTGKSYVVGAVAHAWQNPDLWDGHQRLVIGLASSQIATDVLAGEGLTTRNITRWLNAQRRLEQAEKADAKPTGEDAMWRLHEGDLVVVDESAMTSTADLTAVMHYADKAGAKLLLTGDHRQLAAVGAGGGMGLIAETGIAYELAEVRRFAHEWERGASLRLREGDPAALNDYRKHGRIIDGGAIEQTEEAATRAYLADLLAGKRSLLIVDTNEQAARVSAAVRAELVRLGRVEEHGADLELQGTVAGVGDIVQARLNRWDLAGKHGNSRGPINREQYRVLEVHQDGELIVQPTRRDTHGDTTERMTLPASYVAEHLALGYASTVHSAQGLTVDTSHSVVTSRTGAAALYVGMSRGRDSNTAYVTTLAIPGDAPAGTVNQQQRRDPSAVLADAFVAADTGLAAIAEADASQTEATSYRTPAERFADVAELAVAGRTATSLDRLVDDGLLDPALRSAIAADPNMPGLARVLRRAEVAGHDPHEVLADAARHRSLTGSRSLAKVLHSRIDDAVSLEPAGDSYRDWIPQVDDPVWRRHLEDLAHAAEARRSELGEQAAQQQPGWAVDAFGPVPEDLAQRRTWTRRAGLVAAQRELADVDDPNVALPGPPKPEQVEAYAGWRASWRALGRPDAGRDEAEMSDGQLRLRIRAYQREKAWEPSYVAPELSGTSQAEAHHRQTEQLRRAVAENAVDPDERERLLREAEAAAALAQTLAERKELLAHADNIRGLWYAHTAGTRAAAQRAEAELGARGIDTDHPSQTTSTEDWLQNNAPDAAVDDPDGAPTHEAEMADEATKRRDEGTVFDDRADESAELSPEDIRTLTADDASPDALDDWSRVPTAAETAGTIARAQRALAELERRRVVDEQLATDKDREADLNRWHSDDLEAVADDTASETDVREVSLLD